MASSLADCSTTVALGAAARRCAAFRPMRGKRHFIRRTKEEMVDLAWQSALPAAAAHVQHVQLRSEPRGEDGAEALYLPHHRLSPGALQTAALRNRPAVQLAMSVCSCAGSRAPPRRCCVPSSVASRSSNATSRNGSPVKPRPGPALGGASERLLARPAPRGLLRDARRRRRRSGKTVPLRASGARTSRTRFSVRSPPSRIEEAAPRGRGSSRNFRARARDLIDAGDESKFEKAPSKSSKIRGTASETSG